MYSRILFYSHATQRQFERYVTEANISEVLRNGVVIESHPSNDPFPKELLLGWAGSRPLHVVILNDPKTQTTYVKTVYEPDPTLWEPDCRTRRPKP